MVKIRLRYFVIPEWYIEGRLSAAAASVSTGCVRTWHCCMLTYVLAATQYTTGSECKVQERRLKV